MRVETNNECNALVKTPLALLWSGNELHVYIPRWILRHQVHEAPHARFRDRTCIHTGLAWPRECWDRIGCTIRVRRLLARRVTQAEVHCWYSGPNWFVSWSLPLTRTVSCSSELFQCKCFTMKAHVLSFAVVSTCTRDRILCEARLRSISA